VTECCGRRHFCKVVVGCVQATTEENAPRRAQFAPQYGGRTVSGSAEERPSSVPRQRYGRSPPLHGRN